MINQAHEAARNYIALEYRFHRKEISLRELIEAFNSLTLTERSYLSQAAWEAKKDRLTATR